MRCHQAGPELVVLGASKHGKAVVGEAWRVQESLLAGCLDPADRAVLRFARSHRRADEPVVQAHLGLSVIRYYQRLHVLLDRAEALDDDPELVTRLRADRDRRRQARGHPASTGKRAGRS